MEQKCKNNMKEMLEKNQLVALYETPSVEVIEVEVEKGFAESMDPESDAF